MWFFLIGVGVIFAGCLIFAFTKLDADDSVLTAIFASLFIAIVFSFVITAIATSCVHKETIVEKMDVVSVKTSTGTDFLFKEGKEYKNINTMKFDTKITIGEQMIVQKTTVRVPENGWFFPTSNSTYLLVMAEAR
jgi:hypothetical protein